MNKKYKVTYFNKKGNYYYMNRVKKIVHSQTKWLGQGCVVVVMDTGVASHPELEGKIWKFRDFVNGRLDMYDDNGHGTHICGVIGGKTIGIAPKCQMIVLKVLDENGNGRVECSMQAFRWILENQEKYNIRVVNISMGMPAHSNPEGEKYILGAVELLWNMGITVVAAAGNRGPEEGSITVPGINENIITVGCYDKIHSGRGSVKQLIFKPDLVAPGARISSCNAAWQAKEGKLYIAKSGTSMSTPIVTGAIADLISKESNLTNREIKKRLKESCVDLHLPITRQGSGLLHIGKLLHSSDI